MTNETRKHIWPVSLVMSLAVIGALAVVFVLTANPGATQAHDNADHEAACEAMTEEQRKEHNALAGLVQGAELCGDEPDGGNGATTDTPAVPGFTIEHGGQARQVSVDWDAVEGAVEYKVEYGQCEAEPCSLTMEETVPATTTNYLITGLNAGVQYKVQVTAYNAAGMVLAQSSSLVSTSRYLLTFNTGTTPLRSDPPKP